LQNLRRRATSNRAMQDGEAQKPIIIRPSKEEMPMSRKKLSRRQFVAATALTSAAMITAPYVRGAHAAGKLSMGFWDHWVPGANKASTDLVNEWAAKEKVEVSIDYIPSQGNKNLLTIAAEAQAKSGHDFLSMPTWWPHANAELLEPCNDIMGEIVK